METKSPESVVSRKGLVLSGIPKENHGQPEVAVILSLATLKINHLHG